jgi:hypothetical protein
MPFDWQPIETEADVERLLSAFGEFHDSCLREVHIWTEAHVREDLAFVDTSHLDTHLRVLFQRQWRDPTAIDLLFDELIEFHLAPTPENLGASITDATVFITDGVIYWADHWEWRPDSQIGDDITWVAARRMRWRDASTWMGDKLRYGPNPEG